MRRWAAPDTRRPLRGDRPPRPSRAGREPRRPAPDQAWCEPPLGLLGRPDPVLELAEHLLRLRHHGRVVAVHAAHQPLGEGELGHQGGAAHQVLVAVVGGAGGPPARTVGLEHAVCEVGVLDGGQPGEVHGRVAHMQVGPSGHPDHPAALEQQVLLVQVAVDRDGLEAPELLLLQGGLPAAQQRGRDAAGGRGLVQLVEPAGADLLGGVHREVGQGHHLVREGVDGGHHPGDVRHGRFAGVHQVLERMHGPRHVLVDEGAQPVQADGTGHGRGAEGEVRPHGRREAGEHLKLGLQAHGGLRGVRGADAPALAPLGQHDRRGEVRGVVRAGQHAGRGQARDGSGGKGGEMHGLTVHAHNPRSVRARRPGATPAPVWLSGPVQTPLIRWSACPCGHADAEAPEGVWNTRELAR